jgi:hypothetical protein
VGQRWSRNRGTDLRQFAEWLWLQIIPSHITIIVITITTTAAATTTTATTVITTIIIMKVG